MKKNKEMVIKTGTPFPLGITQIGEGYNFVAELKQNMKCDYYLCFFEHDKDTPAIMIALKDHIVVGDLYAVFISGIAAENYDYAYKAGDEYIRDAYSKTVCNMTKWGIPRNGQLKDNKLSILKSEFEWDNDTFPRLAFENIIIYSFHVRGLTKHASSGVKDKGTFSGVIEKISYFKELGINQILLLPAYDFNEIEYKNSSLTERYRNHITDEKEEECKLNYWGFSEGFYFIPKVAFCVGNSPSDEFKNMVKQLHHEGIEVIMQFFFPDSINRNLIIDCIIYWVLEYHIDGVHIMGENLPIEMLATHPVLAETKIYYHYFDADKIFKKNIVKKYKNLAIYNKEFMYDIRRFLKNDEGMLQAFLYRTRRIPATTGIINYVTEYEGFTLNDLVSYDFKHNETNGEENRDGINSNCSWNCGIEGPTKKNAILNLRKKQMKNALIILFLSQGTPMLLAGDEVANTQFGNNNPYCQDNEMAWVKWKINKYNEEIRLFVKDLIAFRKEHPILHNQSELRVMDYISCGYPDLSYHGDAAWYPKFDDHIRHIGIMLCGKYARINRKKEDDFFYIAYNMHWNIHEFGLPKLPKDMKWYIKINSSDGEKSFMPDGEETILSNQEKLSVSERTIIVLIGRI